MKQLHVINLNANLRLIQSHGVRGRGGVMKRVGRWKVSAEFKLTGCQMFQICVSPGDDLLLS